MGSVFVRQGDLVKALEFYNRALNMQKAVLPGMHCEIAGSLNNIGCVLYEKGEFEEALKNHKMAWAIQMKVLPEHVDAAGSLNNMANAKLKMNENIEALGLYKKALALLKAKLSPLRKAEVVGCLNNIGNVYWMMNQKEKADEIYKEALNV